MSWDGEWAAIGGGSRGLGLALARRAATAGMKVAVVARDLETLEAAAQKLKAAGSPEVRTFSVDLTRPLVQSDSSEARRLQRFFDEASVALAVAAAGRSDRGHLTDLTIAEVHEAITLNVAAALQFSQLARPALVRGRGTLVHVGSIAGLVAAPGMGTYSLSKAALVAMSRQMRQEFRREGIAVMLVCPGPIARADAGRRYDELARRRNLPEHLKAPGGGVNLGAIDPDRLADKIFEAARRRQTELVVPGKVRLLAALAAVFPSLADRIIQRSFAKQDEDQRRN